MCLLYVYVIQQGPNQTPHVHSRRLVHVWYTAPPGRYSRNWLTCSVLILHTLNRFDVILCRLHSFVLDSMCGIGEGIDQMLRQLDSRHVWGKLSHIVSMKDLSIIPKSRILYSAHISLIAQRYIQSLLQQTKIPWYQPNGLTSYIHLQSY